MKSKQVAALGLGLALLTGQAMAEDDVVNLAGSLNASLANQTVNFSTSKLSGLFHDTFDFSFASLAGASAGAVNGLHFQFGNTAPNVDFSKVSLNGVLGTVDNTGTGGLISVFFAGPVAGNLGNAPAYKLEVWGSATTGAQYGGSLSVSMVPEPETYAMLLAGLGVVGFVARRRRS
ncbi:FxDxF family PEP-CTERM protein [Paucibacter sp. APW11]|uniref:FxDxF family PEP-CTERM protein n=1 Tax=Roseateles aquae TaxID=3077235 RepID=A0ABU3PBX6_9BURK|nr:FxDxF family PEP-CTERM protein [Paucibacter sp. APW11]MDT8999653.1 FxDxF family PEP-CTERM protein [Paucibacter sp. APW11]